MRKFVDQGHEDGTKIVGFLWPANTWAYHSARGMTSEAGDRLRHLVDVLLGHGNTVSLMGHSLGARVCLHALQSSDALAAVRHCFLLAAALPHDCFTEHGEFPMESLTGCRDFTIYHSQTDTVLPKYFVLGEMLSEFAQYRFDLKRVRTTALGLTGPSQQDFPAGFNVSVVDLGGAISDHKGRVWLAAARSDVEAKLMQQDSNLAGLP